MAIGWGIFEHSFSSKGMQVMDRNAKDWHASLVPDGMQKVWPARTCQRCRTENTQMSKLYKLKVCFACKLKEDIERKKNPSKILTGILALVLMCCVGCASAPSKATIQVRVAGQEVNVCFKK